LTGRLCHAVLRGLDGNVIGDAGSRVEIEVGCGLEAAAEGDEDALRDVGLGEADFLGAGAVDIHGHIRVVEGLLDAGIGCAGDVADFIEHLLGEGAVAVEVRADDLDVNGGGEAEVEDLGDDVDGQYVEGDPGIFAIQHVA